MAPPEVWANKFDFLMAAFSYAVDFTTLWRFPYLCYKNGGGLFLIPFIFFSIVLVFPLVTFQLTLGQYGRRGPVGVWNLCPLFRGIGWATLVVNFVLNSYYVMFIGYGIYYLASSFTSVLTWADCANYWNTDNCPDAEALCRQEGNTWQNSTCISTSSNDYNLFVPTQLPHQHHQYRVFPSEEFYYNKMLQMSDGFDNLGSARWQLVFCLMGAWYLILVALSLGVTTWGKFAYLTAIGPFIGLLVILCRVASLPGAAEGIKYFITPDYKKLWKLQVWADAAIQVYFASGVGMGSYITMGRYNRFHSNPIIDSSLIVLASICGSIFCGFIVFSAIGFLAHESGLNITQVASVGTELVFVVFPQMLARLPMSGIWSVIFFLSFIGLGLGSAIPGVANILVTLIEVFPALKSRLYRFLVLLLVVAVSFMVGIIFTCNGGIYLLILVDNYGTTFALYIVAFLQVLIISWAYASPRLLQDLSLMTGWWRCFCYMGFWNVICPIFILLLFIYTAIGFAPLQFKDYIFPEWANGLGWFLTVAELMVIPVHLIVVLVMACCTRRLRETVQPTKDWGRELYDTEDTLLSTTETSERLRETVQPTKDWGRELYDTEDTLLSTTETSEV